MTSLSSIQSFKLHGVTRSKIQWLTTHIWQISPDNLKYFSSYFKLHWSPGYTLSQISRGLIVNNSIPYQIEFSRDCTRGKILELAQQGIKDHCVLLSFRTPLSDFKVKPAVLIQVHQNKESQND